MIRNVMCIGSLQETNKGGHIWKMSMSWGRWGTEFVWGQERVRISKDSNVRPRQKMEKQGRKFYCAL